MTSLLRSPPDPDAAPALGMLDGVACGVVLWDPTGAALHANRGALALLGLAPAEPLAPALARRGLQAPTGAGDAPPLRLDLPSGGVAEGLWNRLPDGGWVLTLLDLAPQIEAMERAQRDPLTGLGNRVALHEGLTAAVQGAGCAVLCLDLDRFKIVNDTLGHAMGDALLTRVAQRLQSGVKSGDLVARIGGDEFTVIQSDVADPGEAEALARRLVDLVGRAYAIDGHALNVGVSIGVALCPRHGTEPQELMRRADLALYSAKSAGRGTFRLFETGMDDHLRHRQALEFDLRKALALRQFELLYQPQLDTRRGALAGFEAQLGWRHPQRGLVPPEEFLPLAEEMGVIIPIGEWTLRTACLAAAGWPAPLRIAVNLTPTQLRSPRLIPAVQGALAASGLDPSRLDLEVAEGALLGEIEGLEERLGALRALGVRLSMDELGTGPSTLGRLRSLPFDRLKIDPSFVRDDAPGPDQAILRAVATLGEGLGMNTAAGGVDTARQLDRLRAHGWGEVQGNLVGRPMSARDVAALLTGPPPAAALAPPDGA